jgi:putative FmdB family regulatory protein
MKDNELQGEGMPTYEYQCKKCGHKFEKLQKMTDDPVKKCPECKGVVARMIGAGAGIIFKGKGFYQTDYKCSGAPAKKTEAKSPETPSCGKAGACKSCGS